MSDEERDEREIQGSFFTDHGLARSSDPETSHEAAEEVKVGPLQIAVLRTLRASELHDPPGLTMNQVVEIADRPNESITPRFRPLAAKGLIYDTGEKRRNRSGKNAIVWRITERGRRILEKIDRDEQALDYA